MAGIDTTNYFNLEIIFNELIGSTWLTLIVGAFILFWVGIKFDLGFKPTSILIAIWGIIMFSIATQTLLIVYVLILLGASALAYFIYQRKIQRG